MPKVPQRAQPQDLINLQQASQLLGVHPSTVRLWADQGKLKTFRTAGGHRRFSQQDVSALMTPQSTTAHSGNNAQLIVHSALGRTRMELTGSSLSAQQWYQRYDEATREHHRQLGRRLLGLTMHYLNRQDERPQILQDACKVGREYGAIARKQKLSLSDAMRVFLYFRDFLLESVIQMREVMGNPANEEALTTYRLINEFVNEVLVEFVTTHQQAKKT